MTVDGVSSVTCVHVETTGQYQGSSSVTLYLILWDRSVIEPGASPFCLDCPTSLQVLLSLRLSPLPRTRITDGLHHTWLYVGAEDGTRVLMLVWQALDHRANSPAHFQPCHLCVFFLHTVKCEDGNQSSNFKVLVSLSLRDTTWLNINFKLSQWLFIRLSVAQ